jgi:hypothetical protein
LWGAAERHRRSRFEVAPTAVMDALMRQAAGLQRREQKREGSSAAAVKIGQGSGGVTGICSGVRWRGGGFAAAMLIWEDAG